MSTLPHTSAIHLPTEPYPGLRPFLDHEASLLLGRTSQVHEVIKRLEHTHFVAVVGGSGSGKSSLIRAGVVPKLRGYGIPEAGAYWIPVICTPGTVPRGSVTSGERIAASTRREQTPVTRLAWKLSQALLPLATAENEAERRDEIGTVFRQGAGFTRLVDAYHDELPRRGPDSKDARFLFVIDQFEELFHPNNRDNADARLMVEAVIDHFFNPHERCFVVMTVRSEHLADCAAYLELPDAINKSLYLVRRLNEEELRDAIVGPAKYYLRLLQRGNEAEEISVAADVVFDERLIERLVEDVASISGDADHLPLLQHVLARTWESACHREGVPARGVPAQVTWADLERAVVPDSNRPGGWLRDHDGINTLHSSLENWAEFTYRQHTEDERTQIENVLRNLAFKDPNNGLYFQQRVDVDDPLMLPGFPHPREQLKKLLARGFLDTVNYMFWDDENPDRVTLKVSHEAFIRGWNRFRKLIDVEADRFEEFVAVLRKCALWRVERLPKLLLEVSELARVEDAHLSSVFESGDERKAWFHALLQYHDGERLSKIEPDVDEFLAASRKRLEAIEREKREAAERERAAKEAERSAIEAAREARQQQDIERREHEAQRKQDEAHLLRMRAETERADAVGKRNRLIAFTALGAALLFSAIAVFALVFQNPAMKRIAAFTDARSRAERRRDTNFPGESLVLLKELVEAARTVEQAEQGTPIWGRSANRILDDFDFVPPVAKIKVLLADSSSEPVVNGTLRNLLTTMVWPSATNPAEVEPDRKIVSGRREIQCKFGEKGGSVAGSLLLQMGVVRGVFIPQLNATDTEIKLYDGTFRDGKCTLGQPKEIVWSVPRYLQPEIVFDAQLSHLAVALNDKGRDYVNLYRIDWEHDGKSAASKAIGEKRISQLVMLSVVPNPGSDMGFSSGSTGPPPTSAGLLRGEVASRRNPLQNVGDVQVVDTWRAESGLEVSVAGRAWRVFSEMAIAVPLSADEHDHGWSSLGSATNSGCTRLERMFEGDTLRKGDHRIRQEGDACFDIQRGNSAPAPRARSNQQQANDDTADLQRELLLVTVYNERKLESTPDLKEGNLPTPIASLVFDSVSLDANDRWLIGKPLGDYEGWIAMEQPSGVLAAPWATQALRKLGEQVVKASQTTGGLVTGSRQPSQ